MSFWDFLILFLFFFMALTGAYALGYYHGGLRGIDYAFERIKKELDRQDSRR